MVSTVHNTGEQIRKGTRLSGAKTSDASHTSHGANRRGDRKRGGAISSRFLVPPRRGSPQHARKSHDVRLVFWAPPIPGSEAAFIQGLKVAVFVEGDNISIEQRWVSRCHARIVTHLNVETGVSWCWTQSIQATTSDSNYQSFKLTKSTASSLGRTASFSPSWPRRAWSPQRFY